ncbi:MAG: transposase [Myxococcales bacterium]|nr:transposase [Myxococcales bacterium]
MSKEQRRHLSPEQKLAILREHLVERKPVSDICEQHGIAPSLFYYWQKQLFENGTAAFAQPGRTSSREQQLAARRGVVQHFLVAVDSGRRFNRCQVHAGATQSARWSRGASGSW